MSALLTLAPTACSGSTAGHWKVQGLPYVVTHWHTLGKRFPHARFCDVSIDTRGWMLGFDYADPSRTELQRVLLKKHGLHEKRFPTRREALSALEEVLLQEGLLTHQKSFSLQHLAGLLSGEDTDTMSA